MSKRFPIVEDYLRAREREQAAKGPAEARRWRRRAERIYASMNAAARRQARRAETLGRSGR